MNCQDEKVLEVPQEGNTYTWGGCSQFFEINWAKRYTNFERYRKMSKNALNRNFQDGVRLVVNKLVYN